MAEIILLVAVLAAEERLDWRSAGWLAIVAALRVVFHEIRRRAAVGPAR